jgi:YD repeat-containing protein
MITIIRIKFVIILLIGLILFGIKLHSQEQYGQVTPQTSDFIKYGDIPVSLFIGRMNLEIPVYQIKDRDFDIPVRLLYMADGFKPNKRSDFVGLDWTLIAGGCITREVYGTPDEFIASNWESDELGFLPYVKATGDVKDAVWNFSPPTVTNSADYCYIVNQTTNRQGHWVDYQPDLFLFNFNGHSGQFMINNAGQAQSNDKSYKVDISGLSEQYPNFMFPDTSSIRITDAHGYTYVFGGDLSALEFSISYKEGYQIFAASETHPVILAWHLSKIIAPNGRTMQFNYYSNETLTNANLPVWQANRAKRISTSNPPQFDIIGTATKKAILESIEIDGVKVKFKKSVETTLGSLDNFFSGQNYFNGATYQLDSILVQQGNSILYAYSLSYYNQDRRRFLSSVTQPDNSKYLFRYHHAHSYPAPAIYNGNSDEVDDYGYWNDSNHTANEGLLSEVTYPSGGRTVFEYGKHQYSKSIELDLSTLEKQSVSGTNITVDTIDIDQPFMLAPPLTLVYKYYHNGSRIEKITNYTVASVKLTEKSYLYENNDGKSSGVLYQSRPYFYSRENKVYITERSWNKNYNIDEPAIGYSSVIEKYNDNSYCFYTFSDYISNPDANNTHMKMINSPQTLKLADYISLVGTNVNRVSSNSAMRGLLTSKTIFDAGGIEKQKEVYSYKYVASSNFINLNEWSLIYDCDARVVCPDSSYIVSFRSIVGGGLARKIYLKSHPLVIKTEKRDNVTASEQFIYNSYDQLKIRKTVINSTDTLQITCTHPSDYTNSLYQAMVIVNNVSPVIEQTTTRIKGNVRNETECIRTDYQTQFGLAVPQKISTKYFGTNSWHTDVTYNLYDRYGRLWQQTDDDGIPITYLWGYNYQYPVAEIKNATYDQIKNILEQILIDRVASASTPSDADLTAINNLRSNTNLLNAQITTYTYKPLVGMETMTDPRGVKTTYSYDSFGRLQTIKDENDKTTENYDYHYKD